MVSILSNLIKRSSKKTLNVSPFPAPRLLVSVRNSVEAEAALAGGCDVLDVKEPGRGAMGMADESTIAAVVARVLATNSSVPVSVALGETREWESQNRVLRLPAHVAYLKLGTAGLGSRAAWGERFAQIMQGFAGGDRDERGETARQGGLGLRKWIAVGYADWEIADGPCPDEVLEAAVAAIRGGRNQYPPGAGVPELRAAVADHHARFYDLSVDPEREVLVTVGATEAIAAAHGNNSENSDCEIGKADLKLKRTSGGPADGFGHRSPK
jgi:hypothetical protein